MGRPALVAVICVVLHIAELQTMESPSCATVPQHMLGKWTITYNEASLTFHPRSYIVHGENTTGPFRLMNTVVPLATLRCHETSVLFTALLGTKKSQGNRTLAIYQCVELKRTSNPQVLSVKAALQEIEMYKYAELDCSTPQSSVHRLYFEMALSRTEYKTNLLLHGCVERQNVNSTMKINSSFLTPEICGRTCLAYGFLYIFFQSEECVCNFLPSQTIQFYERSKQHAESAQDASEQPCHLSGQNKRAAYSSYFIFTEKYPSLAHLYVGCYVVEDSLVHIELHQPFLCIQFCTSERFLYAQFANDRCVCSNTYGHSGTPQLECVEDCEHCHSSSVGSVYSLSAVLALVTACPALPRFFLGEWYIPFLRGSIVAFYNNAYRSTSDRMEDNHNFFRVKNKYVQFQRIVCASDQTARVVAVVWCKDSLNVIRQCFDLYMANDGHHMIASIREGYAPVDSFEIQMECRSSSTMDTTDMIFTRVPQRLEVGFGMPESPSRNDVPFVSVTPLGCAEEDILSLYINSEAFMSPEMGVDDCARMCYSQAMTVFSFFGKHYCHCGRRPFLPRFVGLLQRCPFEISERQQWCGDRCVKVAVYRSVFTHNAGYETTMGSYMACISKFTGATITTEGSDKSSISIDWCINWCREKKYKYAGLQYGKTCICNNFIKKSHSLDNATCFASCNAGWGSYCGGLNGQVAVYHVKTHGDVPVDFQQYLNLDLAAYPSAQTNCEISDVNEYTSNTAASAESLNTTKGTLEHPESDSATQHRTKRNLVDSKIAVSSEKEKGSMMPSSVKSDVFKLSEEQEEILKSFEVLEPEGEVDGVFQVMLKRGVSTAIDCLPRNSVMRIRDATISWWRGKMKPITDGRFVLLETGALEIKDAEPADTGLYTCDIEGVNVITNDADEVQYQHMVTVYAMPELYFTLKFQYNVKNCDSAAVAYNVDRIRTFVCDRVDCGIRRISGKCEGSTVIKMEVLVFPPSKFYEPHCSPKCIAHALIASLNEELDKVRQYIQKDIDRPEPMLKFVTSSDSMLLSIECEGGFYRSESCLCLPCLPGTYATEEDEECITCSIGFYQPGFAMDKCLSCPVDTNTTNEGSRHREDCRKFAVLTIPLKKKELVGGAAVIAAVGVLCAAVGFSCAFALCGLQKKRKQAKEREKEEHKAKESSTNVGAASAVSSNPSLNASASTRGDLNTTVSSQSNFNRNAAVSPRGSLNAPESNRGTLNILMSSRGGHTVAVGGGVKSAVSSPSSRKSAASSRGRGSGNSGGSANVSARSKSDRSNNNRSIVRGSLDDISISNISETSKSQCGTSNNNKCETGSPEADRSNKTRRSQGATVREEGKADGKSSNTIQDRESKVGRSEKTSKTQKSQDTPDKSKVNTAISKSDRSNDTTGKTKRMEDKCSTGMSQTQSDRISKTRRSQGITTPGEAKRNGSQDDKSNSNLGETGRLKGDTNVRKSTGIAKSDRNNTTTRRSECEVMENEASKNREETGHSPHQEKVDKTNTFPGNTGRSKGDRTSAIKYKTIGSQGDKPHSNMVRTRRFKQVKANDEKDKRSRSQRDRAGKQITFEESTSDESKAGRNRANGPISRRQPYECRRLVTSLDRTSLPSDSFAPFEPSDSVTSLDHTSSTSEYQAHLATTPDSRTSTVKKRGRGQPNAVPGFVSIGPLLSPTPTASKKVLKPDDTYHPLRNWSFSSSNQGSQFSGGAFFAPVKHRMLQSEKPSRRPSLEVDAPRSAFPKSKQDDQHLTPKNLYELKTKHRKHLDVSTSSESEHLTRLHVEAGEQLLYESPESTLELQSYLTTTDTAQPGMHKHGFSRSLTDDQLTATLLMSSSNSVSATRCLERSPNATRQHAPDEQQTWSSSATSLAVEDIDDGISSAVPQRGAFQQPQSEYSASRSTIFQDAAVTPHFQRSYQITQGPSSDAYLQMKETVTAEKQSSAYQITQRQPHTYVQMNNSAIAEKRSSDLTMTNSHNIQGRLSVDETLVSERPSATCIHKPIKRLTYSETTSAWQSTSDRADGPSEIHMDSSAGAISDLVLNNSISRDNVNQSHRFNVNNGSSSETSAQQEQLNDSFCSDTKTLETITDLSIASTQRSWRHNLYGHNLMSAAESPILRKQRDHDREDMEPSQSPGVGSNCHGFTTDYSELGTWHRRAEPEIGSDEDDQKTFLPWVPLQRSSSPISQCISLEAHQQGQLSISGSSLIPSLPKSPEHSYNLAPQEELQERIQQSSETHFRQSHYRIDQQLTGETLPWEADLSHYMLQHSQEGACQQPAYKSLENHPVHGPRVGISASTSTTTKQLPADKKTVLDVTGDKASNSKVNLCDRNPNDAMPLETSPSFPHTWDSSSSETSLAVESLLPISSQAQPVDVQSRSSEPTLEPSCQHHRSTSLSSASTTPRLNEPYGNSCGASISASKESHEMLLSQGDKHHQEAFTVSLSNVPGVTAYNNPNTSSKMRSERYWLPDESLAAILQGQFGQAHPDSVHPSLENPDVHSIPDKQEDPLTSSNNHPKVTDTQTLSVVDTKRCNAKLPHEADGSCTPVYPLQSPQVLEHKSIAIEDPSAMEEDPIKFISCYEKSVNKAVCLPSTTGIANYAELQHPVSLSSSADSLILDVGKSDMNMSKDHRDHPLDGSQNCELNCQAHAGKKINKDTMAGETQFEHTSQPSQPTAVVALENFTNNNINNSASGGRSMPPDEQTRQVGNNDSGNSSSDESVYYSCESNLEIQARGDKCAVKEFGIPDEERQHRKKDNMDNFWQPCPVSGADQLSGSTSGHHPCETPQNVFDNANLIKRVESNTINENTLTPVHLESVSEECARTSSASSTDTTVIPIDMSSDSESVSLDPLEDARTVSSRGIGNQKVSTSLGARGKTPDKSAALSHMFEHQCCCQYDSGDTSPSFKPVPLVPGWMPFETSLCRTPCQTSRKKWLRTKPSFVSRHSELEDYPHTESGIPDYQLPMEYQHMKQRQNLVRTSGSRAPTYGSSQVPSSKSPCFCSHCTQSGKFQSMNLASNKGTGERPPDEASTRYFRPLVPPERVSDTGYSSRLIRPIPCFPAGKQQSRVGFSEENFGLQSCDVQLECDSEMPLKNTTSSYHSRPGQARHSFMHEDYDNSFWHYVPKNQGGAFYSKGKRVASNESCWLPPKVSPHSTISKKPIPLSPQLSHSPVGVHTPQDTPRPTSAFTPRPLQISHISPHKTVSSLHAHSVPDTMQVSQAARSKSPPFCPWSVRDAESHSPVLVTADMSVSSQSSLRSCEMPGSLFSPLTLSPDSLRLHERCSKPRSHRRLPLFARGPSTQSDDSLTQDCNSVSHSPTKS